MEYIPDKDEVADSTSAGPSAVSPRESAGNTHLSPLGDKSGFGSESPRRHLKMTGRGVVTGVAEYATQYGPLVKYESRKEECFAPGHESRTYFFQPAGGGNIKIGKAKCIVSRFRDIQAYCPVKLHIIGILPGNFEHSCHFHFSEFRLHGEWFLPNKKLLEFIRNFANDVDASNPIYARDRLPMACFGYPPEKAEDFLVAPFLEAKLARHVSPSLAALAAEASR